MHRFSVGFRIRIEYSSCTDQPGCNTKNNVTVESRIHKSYWEKKYSNKEFNTDTRIKMNDAMNDSYTIFANCKEQ